MNRVIENVDNTSSLSDFYCGVLSMDEFIHKKHEGLNDFVVNGLTSLWVIKEND